MSKEAPQKMVKQQFESKEKLVERLLPLLDVKDAETKKRLLRASNNKLLKLYKAGMTVKEKYNSRSELIQKIMATKYATGKKEDDVLVTLQNYSVKRLLEIIGQHGK